MERSMSSSRRPQQHRKERMPGGGDPGEGPDGEQQAVIFMPLVRRFSTVTTW